MKPLAASEIKGTWGTLLLPVNQDESIDWSRLSDEIDALLCSGVDGIYSNGTAGEFYAQTEEEFDRVQGLLASKCEEAAMPFQIGASHPCPATSLERVRRALQWRPGAIQVILPDWSPVNRIEFLRFLSGIAEAAAPTGIVLYNPPHAKRVLSPEEIGAIARAVPGLVGVKVAGGDENWYAAMRQCVPGLSVFVPGHLLATGMRLGASGSYSNVACINPAGAVGWNRLMESDPRRALDVERRILAFFTEYLIPVRDRHRLSNQALDKLLAWLGGWADIGLRLRWPYQAVEEAEAAPLRPVVREKIPELFEE